MVNPSQYTRVPAHRAGQYRNVAESLYSAAEDLATLAGDESGYGNAIGVLVVHAAIAWTDALTIAYDERKHTGGQHRKAADLLLEAVGEPNVDADKRKKLQAILRAKEEVSYMGEYYREDQALTLLTKLRAYRRWAREVYERRP